MGSLPRYLPGRALPASAHVPGRSSRPATTAIDPGPEPPPGHAPGLDAPAAWRHYPAYLWAVDLYNHGYPWEAHEAWEALWQRAPAGSVVRLMLQALIQCAAAVVHARDGRAAGVAAVGARAVRRLDQVVARAGPRFLGLDVARFRDAFRAWMRSHQQAGARGADPDWPRIALDGGASRSEPVPGSRADSA